MNGLVLSGGGARAAYQVGALKAIAEHYPQFDDELEVIMGSSLGAINGVLVAAGLRAGYQQATNALLELWNTRTFENTFGGSISLTLMRSLKVGFLQYLYPGPRTTSTAIFDPTPLRQDIDEILFSFGGASVENHPRNLKAVGVMATKDGGGEREGLLIVNSKEHLCAKSQEGISFSIHYVNHLSSSHAFASAALPFVMPPVQLDLEHKTVNLVDGGIADNVPIDPAIRFGADKIFLVDTSGKKWWHDYYDRPYDTAEPWSLDSPAGSFCPTPKCVVEICSKQSFGKILKDSTQSSTREFIRALGPVWPIYQVLYRTMGEEVAFEILSYAVVHKSYLSALIDLGYCETQEILKKSSLLKA